MYGWRGRLGIIYPVSRGKNLEDTYKIIPEGVGVIPAIIGFTEAKREEFEQGFETAEHISTKMASMGANAILIAGLPPFILKGLDYEIEWSKKLEEKIKIPVATPMKSVLNSLKALGIQKPVVATYFGKELNDRIVETLTHAGLQVVAIESYTMRMASSNRDKGMYSAPLLDLDMVGWTDVYQFCREIFKRSKGEADGIYIVGSGWEHLEAIQKLEDDLDTKVVSGKIANIFEALTRMEVRDSITGYGKLLRLLSPN